MTDVDCNSINDTFTVDNLGFDGDNVYNRGTAVSSLRPYSVYKAVARFPNSETGSPINQFTYRAIYGVSTSGNTQFAIVRTGPIRMTSLSSSTSRTPGCGGGICSVRFARLFWQRC